MKEKINKIITLKDNVLTNLIEKGFDIDLRSEVDDSKSIKQIIQEVSSIFKILGDLNGRTSFSFDIFFTKVEKNTLETNIERITSALEHTILELDQIEELETVFIQSNGVFDIPNPSENARERQLNPQIDISLSLVPDALDGLKPLVRTFLYKGSESRGDTIRKLTDSLLSVEKLQSDFLTELTEAKKNSSEISKFKNIIYELSTESQKILDDCYQEREKVIELTQSTVKDITKERERLEAAIALKEDREVEYLSFFDSLKKSKDDASVLLKDIQEINRNTSSIIDSITEAALKANSAKSKMEGYFKEIGDTIAKANSVLNLSGTVSIGKFFDEQYNNASLNIHYWLYGAGASLIIAIAICFWALIGSSGDHEFSYIVSRLSIVPLVLAGVWFCATQYIKQKNILEDYAYKRVLALSMISFREEISQTTPKEVSSYMKAVLNELHKPPLDSLDKKQFKEESKMLKVVQAEFFKNFMQVFDKNIKETSSTTNQEKK